MGGGLLSDDTKSRFARALLTCIESTGKNSEQHETASLMMRETVGTHMALPANRENLAFDVSGDHSLSLMPCILNFRVS